MAVETPSWLNQSFMEKVLRKSENDNSIKVIDIFTKPATNKGDNYTSDMIRVITDYSRDKNGRKTTEKISIIVKISPIAEGVRKDLITRSGIFDIEIRMMSDTLERMNKLLAPKTRLNAKCYFVEKGDPTLIAMEDLAPLQFRMADRQAGLDLTHCILALHGLAKFHAASVGVCEQDPNHKKQYMSGMFNDEFPPEMSAFFVLGTKALAAEVEQWPELGKRYGDKISKLSDHIYQKGIDICKCNEDEFNVINHGDFWVNNMLFRYGDDGKPIEHIFVDFQLAFYTTPAIDLHYFLNTSPRMDIIENNKQTLLDEYLGTLSTTMKQIGCKTKPPTMQQLKDALKRRAIFGMIASFSVLPLVVWDKDQAKDIDEIMNEDGSYENPAYKGEIFRKMITKRIPMYDECGFLDI